MQAAFEAGEATRDPTNGAVFLATGVTIENDDGEAPMTGEMELWADALAILREHGGSAIEFADGEVERLGGDAPNQARWVLVRRRIVHIMEAAAKDARE